VILGRVSSPKQGKNFDTKTNRKRNEDDDTTSDLERQIEKCREYCRREFGVDDPEVYADVGSGISYSSRKNFMALTQKILNQEMRGTTIVSTLKDRPMRFGHELWNMILEANGTSIRFIADDPEKSDEQELVEDMLMLTTIFSSKIHGKRGAETTKRTLSPEVVSYCKKLLDSDHPVEMVLRECERCGFTTEQGTPISRWVLYKYWDGNGSRQVLDALLPTQKTENSWEIYRRQCLEFDERDESDWRLPKKQLMDHYLEFCKRENLLALSARAVGGATQEVPRKYTHTGHVALVGVRIRQEK
jgi:predicted site-specific integrase-resolvase